MNCTICKFKHKLKKRKSAVHCLLRLNLNTWLPGGSVVKNPPANARDVGHSGTVPGWGRSGEGNSNPLQYHCLENPMDWNAKVGSQEIPILTGKFGLGVQNEAGQRLIEFSQEIALVIANTSFQQPKKQHYKWTSPDGQNQNQIDYIFCC